MTLSTYTLEEYLHWETVDDQLRELINDRIEELEDAEATLENLENKLSEIEGEIDNTLEKLYHPPRQHWERHSLFRDTYNMTQRVEILLTALDKIKGII